jgi:hypothetical protein
MPIQKADRIVVDRAFVAKTVEDIFLKYRADLIQDLRESLIAVDRDQPGNLLESIDGFIKVEFNNISFELVMNDYWKFVDKGVDGWKQSRGSEYKYKRNTKRIPLDAMLKLIKFRGLVPESVEKPNKRVNKKLGAKKINAARESYAWALGAVIKRDGLKPTHFFTDVINENLKQRLTKEISEALKKDIEINFTT